MGKSFYYLRFFSYFYFRLNQVLIFLSQLLCLFNKKAQVFTAKWLNICACSTASDTINGIAFS